MYLYSYFNKIGLTVVTLTAQSSTNQPCDSLSQGLTSHVNVVWAYLRVDEQQRNNLKCLTRFQAIPN